VTVEEGPIMLPAVVARDDPGVALLQEANKLCRGQPTEASYGMATFDAGGLTSRGIPAVMFGAGGGVFPLGPDFVPISMVELEAKILVAFIVRYLARKR
jgi:acetylornithine deacetylase/succinyl-diaminopimelate desuccinylase-like protein